MILVADALDLMDFSQPISEVLDDNFPWCNMRPDGLQLVQLTVTNILDSHNWVLQREPSRVFFSWRWKCWGEHDGLIYLCTVLRSSMCEVKFVMFLNLIQLIKCFIYSGTIWWIQPALEGKLAARWLPLVTREPVYLNLRSGICKSLSATSLLRSLFACRSSSLCWPSIWRFTSSLSAAFSLCSLCQGDCKVSLHPHIRGGREGASDPFPPALSCRREHSG